MRRVQPRRGVRHPVCARRPQDRLLVEDVGLWRFVGVALEQFVDDAGCRALVDAMVRVDGFGWAVNVAVDRAGGRLVPWSAGKVRWDDWAQVESFLWWRSRLLGVTWFGDDDWVDADLAERWDPDRMGDDVLLAYWAGHMSARVHGVPLPDVRDVADQFTGDGWPRRPVRLSSFEAVAYSTLGYFADPMMMPLPV